MGERKARRARGTGTIFFSQRRGCWVGRLPVGRGIGGKTVYVERTADTQRGVIEKLKKAGPPGDNTTVGDWCDRWLEASDVRAGTRLTYSNHVANQIRPTLGHLKLTALTSHHVEQAMRKWAKPAGTLGPNTLRLVVATLGAALGSAVRSGVIPTNPAASAKKPRGRKAEIDPFSPAELAAIVAEGAARPGTRVISTLAATGMRIGEALALDVSDWDRDAGTISITKTVGQKRAHGVGPPKSRNGVRTIRAPEILAPVLNAAAGARKSGKLFAVNGKDRPCRNSVGVALDRLLARLGFRRRNLHQLRHSVITALVSANVPLGDVARFAGDTVATIVATYLHPAGTDPTAALDRLYGGGKVGSPGPG